MHRELEVSDAVGLLRNYNGCPLGSSQTHGDGTMLLRRLRLGVLVGVMDQSKLLAFRDEPIS
jgi:hypothetical protein